MIKIMIIIILMIMIDTINVIFRDGIENTFYDITVISSINRDTVIDLVRKFGKLLCFDRFDHGTYIRWPHL